MVLGGKVLWDLATWNQRHDDLRGVDAIAVIGDAGSYYLTYAHNERPERWSRSVDDDRV